MKFTQKDKEIYWQNIQRKGRKMA